MLVPGTHEFRATANVTKVTPGKEDMLVLHTPCVEPEMAVHAVIKLEELKG